MRDTAHRNLPCFTLCRKTTTNKHRASKLEHAPKTSLSSHFRTPSIAFLYFYLEEKFLLDCSLGHPNLMLRFPSPRHDPFFWKSKKKKKKKILESLLKKQVLQFPSTRSCLININCLKLSSILRFCSLFRHLIVLLIYIFYHLIISCRLNVRFNMQSCVHSFFFFFFGPIDRPTFTRGGRWETKHSMGMAQVSVWNLNIHNRQSNKEVFFGLVGICEYITSLGG